jgi:hypothetical protein
MDDPLVTVARFRDPAMAELVRGKLLAEGLACDLVDEQTIAINWLWSDALGGVKVRVKAEEAERAREVIDRDLSSLAFAAEASSERLLICPRCGASAVRRDEDRGEAAVGLGVKVVSIRARPGRRRAACDSCGHAWRLPVTRVRAELESYADTGPDRDPRAFAAAGRWLLFATMAAIAAWMALH